MSAKDSEWLYLHFEWTMPAMPELGLLTPLRFSVIAVELLIRDAPPYVEGLRSMLGEPCYLALKQEIESLLKDPAYGPQQQHLLAFSSANTPNPVLLGAGAEIILRSLKSNYSPFNKTVSLISVSWEEFGRIEANATRGGFSPSHPPSNN